jgi:hypothetical protein
VSEQADAPLGRAEALGRLRSGLESLEELAEQLGAAPDDRERRAVLLALITAAWTVRDRCTEAYEALLRTGETDGLSRGVLE